MNLERHIDQKPGISLLITIFWIAICFVICSRIFSLQSSILAYYLTSLVIVPVCGVTGTLISAYLWGVKIILTDEGIQTTGRLNTRNTPWNQIVQVVALEYVNERVLMLLKQGGKCLERKPAALIWYLLCNTGKLIWLPDDQFTRAFVAEYYGPLDFDWNREVDE